MSKLRHTVQDIRDREVRANRIADARKWSMYRGYLDPNGADRHEAEEETPMQEALRKAGVISD